MLRSRILTSYSFTEVWGFVKLSLRERRIMISSFIVYYQGQSAGNHVMHGGFSFGQRQHRT